MPEVEVMVERLQKFVGYDIISADGRGGARYLPGNEKVFVSGQRIEGVFRRGKFIIFMLERGAILAHNAMSGYWDTEDERWTFDYVEGKRASKDSDIRCSFLLALRGEPLKNGINLFFHDARKFGFLKYLEPGELAKRLSKMGPEITTSRYLYEPSTVFTEEQFVDVVMKSDKPVKEILMNQDKIAGVGNIYAAEACWLAEIDPFRAGNKISTNEAAHLFDCTDSVLFSAVLNRLDYAHLGVYRQKKCSRCSGEIRSAKLKGRSTYWCPSCQK